MEEDEHAGDLAATAAHDTQVPDLPERPTIEENGTPDRSQQQQPPGEPAPRRGRSEFNKTEKPEEQHTEIPRTCVAHAAVRFYPTHPSTNPDAPLNAPQRTPPIS